MPFLIVQRYNGSQSALQGQVLRMERRISTVGFFFFKSVLPSSISVRSYSSLPTLQGRTAVESTGTTRIRHTQALWTQSVTTNNRLDWLYYKQSVVCTICCHDYLLSWQTIDTSTSRFVELSKCRKTNGYAIKGRIGTSSHYRNNTDAFPLFFLLFSWHFPAFPRSLQRCFWALTFAPDKYGNGQRNSSFAE